MYDEIMNRPMFQTPQQRQGAGIMAGVAPIRGYADGDLVEDDDSMIASLLAQAEELPEALSNLTMEDAVGYVKENPEILFAAIPGLGVAGGVALRFGPGAARSALSLGRRLLAKKKPGKDLVPYVSKLDKAKSAGKQVGSGISKIIRNPIKSTIAGTGIYALAKQFPDLELDKLIDQPEVKALYETLPKGLRNSIQDFKDNISPADPVEITSSAAKRLDTENKKTLVDQQGPPPPPPEPPSMYERAKGFLQDPANQYAFAKAAAPSEGATPRNFASDFVLGKEEYKTIEAARGDETALEQNLALLRREKPEASVDELLNLLLSKDTATEKEQRYQDAVLSLFTEGGKDPKNLDKTREQRMLEAQQEAANILYGVPISAPTASQTIDLEVSE